MMRKLSDLWQDASGTSLIEMAMVAPFLATLVIGITDLSRGYSDRLQLEQAAQRAIEKSMQGMQGDDSTTIFKTLKAEAATAAGVPESDVEVRYWLECNGVSQNSSSATMDEDYEKVCPSGEVYARYLRVAITKKYTPMFSTKWLGTNADGTFTLVGTAGLRVQ
jgi:Flp pilus assembly protein TadG